MLWLIAFGPTLARSSVYPSAGARATRSAARFPLAPGRFSTTTGTFSPADILSASRRAVTSDAPPGGYGTTTWIGLEGKPWANERSAQAEAATPATAVRKSRRER